MVSQERGEALLEFCLSLGSLLLHMFVPGGLLVYCWFTILRSYEFVLFGALCFDCTGSFEYGLVPM